MINLEISRYGHTGLDGASPMLHGAGTGNRKEPLEMQGQMMQGELVNNSQSLIKQYNIIT